MKFRSVEKGREANDARNRKAIAKWEGGDVIIWSYTVSHRVLTIRVVAESRHGNLHISCGDCEHFVGPLKWSNCHFELIRENSGEDSKLILKDEHNKFAVICGVVEVKENVSPIY